MERKNIQVDGEVFNKVKAMYPDTSWTNILKKLLEPIDSLKTSIDSLKTSKDSLYATKDDLKIELKTLRDKFSTVLTQLIDKNNLQR